jgi:hypothetical protein
MIGDTLAADLLELATSTYWNTAAKLYASRGIPASNMPWDHIAESLQGVEREAIAAAIMVVIDGVERIKTGRSEASQVSTTPAAVLVSEHGSRTVNESES